MTDVVRLGDLATLIESGFACGKSKLVEIGLPHLRPFNIGVRGDIDSSEIYRVPPDLVPVSKSILQSGDILFNNTNSRDLVGKLAYVEADVRAGFSNHITRVRLDRSRCEPQFAAYYLLRLWSLGYFRDWSTQWVNQAAFGPRLLANVLIPLPSFDEQRRIVEILNGAARIERLRTQAADRLRELIKALFIKMFSDQAARSQHWPVATIERLLARRRGSIRSGPFGSQLRHSEFTDQGVPVLGIDNVVANRFLWAKPRHVPPEKYANFSRYRVFPGDVIITIMGTTGRVCVAPDDLPECMSTKHLCVLTLDRSLVEPLFVWGALLFDDNVRAQTRVHGQGQIMEGWNLTIVKRLRLRIPPIEIQRSFARTMVRIMALENIVLESSDTASDLRASLMARLLGDCP